MAVGAAARLRHASVASEMVVVVDAAGDALALVSVVELAVRAFPGLPPVEQAASVTSAASAAATPATRRMGRNATGPPPPTCYERRMPVTRLGLQIPNFTYPGVSDRDLFEQVAAIASTAESSGFDSVWVMDHFYQIGVVGPSDHAMLEAYTLLGALAARTSTVNLGALVTGVTYRNPSLLAKVVTTLDVVSSGRAILGIGAAWNEEEHDGMGFDFPPAGERLRRLEEALQICRAMFTEDRPTFHGRYYRIDGALNVPPPVRPGGPPILVGGGGEQKTLRLVAKYADACNLFGDAATVRHKLDVLRRHCDDVGRDPAEITKTRLGGLIIAATDAEADRKAAALLQQGRVTDMRVRSSVVGGPERVTEKVGELMACGLDGLMFNMPDAEDLDTVAFAGKVVGDAIGDALG